MVDKVSLPVTVIIDKDLLVEGVIDAEGNWLAFNSIDMTSWENGECPYCNSNEIVWAGVRKVKLDGWSMPITVGGKSKCRDCGCSEDTDPVEWVKRRYSF